MELGLSPAAEDLRDRVRAMVRQEILPLEEEYFAEVGRTGDRFVHTPRQLDILNSLKAKARSEGLWNFWLTRAHLASGSSIPDADIHDLSTVEYAYLAEEMGWSHIAPEIFNCNAPDTGNMDVLVKYGTDAQKERWLTPLLEGDIRSAYLMTEPDVASSDATNISLKAERDGDHWVLNGEKYWASGAGDPRCAIYIVMVKSDPDADRHRQHSQILVPSDTPGLEILRPMHIFGHDDAPHGHMHIRFTDVRVPHDHLVLGRGRGFEVAQGRLGPGRIHHCMRAIGQAERALGMMCKRALNREAFGKPIASLGANYDIIADCRMDIEMARLLCLKTAWIMDQGDVRAAAPWISKIKVVGPRMATKVLDEAMQIFGATGISQDVPLSRMWMHLRTLRFADGPDAVHRRQVARQELRQYSNQTS